MIHAGGNFQHSRLRGAQLNVHTAQRIDDLREVLEISLDIVVYMYAEILLQRLIQKLKSAPGVSSVQTVGAVSRDCHIQVSHKGNHGDLTGLGIHMAEHHRI